MKDWLTYVLHGMVSKPELLVIEEKKDDLGILFTVSTTNQRDAGILIGSKGEHINAIRVLLRTCGHLHGVKASIKISTPR